MLYRLFAPLFVVVLIIGGVGLSSELVKDSQEKQTAITIAYAGSCPAGAIPVPQSCTARDSKGKIIPSPCSATHPVAGKITGVCTEWSGVGCCLGQQWPSATTATQLQGGAGAIKSINDIMNSLMQMMGQGGQDQSGQEKVAPPVCKRLIASTSLPLLPGEKATLTWLLEGGKATSIVVSPSVGKAQGFSVSVSPRVSTTYTVVASNESGSSTCPKVRVFVGPRADIDGDTYTNDSTYDNGVDIWSGNSDNNEQTGNPYSTYDDLSSDNTNTNANSNDLVTENILLDIDYINDGDGEYATAVSDNGINYGGVVYETPNNNQSADSEQTNTEYADFSQGIYNEEFYDYGDVDNSSGLTDQEIYGIWNRPQNPTTGGLSSGSSSSGGAIDLSREEGTGLFSSIGMWIKSTFCFWCDNSAYINNKNLTASVNLIGKDYEQVFSNYNDICNNKPGSVELSMSPATISRPACAVGQSKQECDDAWRGEKVKLEWKLSCAHSCLLTGPDSLSRGGIQYNGSTLGVLRNTSMFNIQCKDRLGNKVNDRLVIKVEQE